MAVDYPGAIDMMLPLSYSFSTNAHKKIVDHGTGGNMTLDSLYNTFMSTMRSTHFGIGRDGKVAQFVPLSRGAGGNCCPDRDANGNLLCSAFWVPLVGTYGNLNLCTISIEHCNDSQNGLPLTEAQRSASNKLNLWLCQRYHLSTSDIHSHASINPINKSRCPGPAFDFTQMFRYINTVLQQNGERTNVHMERQFHDLWLKGHGTNTDGKEWKAFPSGIYQLALHAFVDGKMSACMPTSDELPSNDWSGNPGLFQTFSNGYYAFWWSSDGHGHIYSAENEQVA